MVVGERKADKAAVADKNEVGRKTHTRSSKYSKVQDQEFLIWRMKEASTSGHSPVSVGISPASNKDTGTKHSSSQAQADPQDDQCQETASWCVEA